MPQDLESSDPQLYARRIVYLRDIDAAELDAVLAALDLTFVDDSNDEALVYETDADRRASALLKPGGDQLAVTAVNLAEYVQLFVEHRLVAAIRPQIEAFREGLAAFVDEPLRAVLRKCCMVAEVKVCDHPVAPLVHTHPC